MPVETPVRSAPPKFTYAEYVERERHSDLRHEFLEGEIIPMPGTSLPHSRIALNLGICLDRAFGERDYFVAVESIRVRVSPTRYRYPDVVALCGEPVTDLTNPPALLNPQVIFEVLSSSTEETDRTDKFLEYDRIATLTDYVLIAQNEIAVFHYTRENGEWKMRELTDPTETITLTSLEVTLALSDLYRKVLPTQSEAN